MHIHIHIQGENGALDDNGWHPQRSVLGGLALQASAVLAQAVRAFASGFAALYQFPRIKVFIFTYPAGAVVRGNAFLTLPAH
jgi:hypothetical protein